jgi:hypothetical protein
VVLGLPVSECSGWACGLPGRGRPIAHGGCRVGPFNAQISSLSPMRSPDQKAYLRVLLGLALCTDKFPVAHKTGMRRREHLKPRV